MKYIFHTTALVVLATIMCCKSEIKKKYSQSNNTTQHSTITPKKNKLLLPKAVVLFENIKSRDTVFIEKNRFFTQKTAIYTTYSDSLEIKKKTIFNKIPVNKKMEYTIENSKFLNLTIDNSLAKYNYFLTANDTLKVEFDENGFISSSSLNNNKNHPALLFSKNIIPLKTIEYLKFVKRYLGKRNDSYFERNYEKKFNSSVAKIEGILKKASLNLIPERKKALEEHLTLVKLKNQFAKGINVKLVKNDNNMNLASYRTLSDHFLQQINEINYVDNPKIGIDKAFETIKLLTEKKSLEESPKTNYMIIRKLLDITGRYEPNLLPELITKIPNTKIKKEYLERYTAQYLLKLKEKRNAKKPLHLITNNEQNIISFENFVKKNKGKVIYVDLWASWCAPCRKQLKASHLLKRELKAQPIVFAYLSLDNSYAKWKTASTEEEINDHENNFMILNAKTSEKYTSWNVRGIPRYLIFDKNGNLVNKNAPFPNNPEAKKELLKYSNK